MHGRRLALAAAATLALCAAASADAATLKPSGLSPLELRGSGFAPRERVRVTVTPTGGAEHIRRVRARRNGSFAVTFAGVRTCDGIEALAVGRRGSRASFQLSALGCPDS